jgi:YVTN family beta-propeller protein
MSTLRLLVRAALPVVVAGAAIFAWLPGRSVSHALSNAAPTFSSPIVFDRTEAVIAAVNPDNDTVSIIAVSSGLGSKAAELAVGREPQSLVFSNDNAKLYVANTFDGTVTVYAVANGSLLATIRVGTEPWGIALTPNGKKLYVANSASNSVSVIDTATDKVIKTIFRAGLQPRGLAITSDGDSDDNDEKVYVTNFLAVYRSAAAADIRPGDDEGKVGLLSVISTSTDEVIRTVQLNPLADTGFKADGDARNKIAPTGTATIITGAFPNILASAAIKNNRVYVPGTGSSPNGPVKFNVNVQSLVSVVDVPTDVDAGKTVNLNSGVQFEADANDASGRPLKRFLTNPYFIAFRHNSNSGYIVSAASDQIVKMDLAADGKPTINAPAAAGGADGIKRVLVGSNPRAMIISSDDTRGYVWNYVSRDVTIIDLTGDAAIGRFILANQPADAQQIRVQRGKELFNTSIGPTFPVAGVTEGAMADRGWCACASCHPNGLTDKVAWMFPSGPRVSTPLNSTFAPSHDNQRALNWSAIFDEVADFELNTRAVAGGSGLIRNADGTQDTNVKAFDPKSGGRSADRDSITEYLAFGIRTPVSPVPDGDLRAGEGRKIFKAAGCTNCHGGSNFTSSHLEFPPPPPASALVTEQGVAQLVGQLKQVGTFNAAAPFELIGTGANISKQALGASGFNTPSLRGVHYGPYLHNGTAPTLFDVINNKAHVGNSPLLDVPTKRAQLVRFLQSIDDKTAPFSEPREGEERDDRSQ